MSIKLIQTKKTTLSYGINDSATTIQLQNLLKLDGSSIAASDIGDELQGTFAPGTSREEIFLIDGANVVVNADGTVTITSVLRGRKEVSPYGSGGFSADHGAGEIVIFGNNPQLYDKMAFKENANTFSEQNIFNNFAPQTDTDPINPNDLTRLSYVQTLVLGVLTTINVIVPGKAGETISGAGKGIYFDETDNEWKLWDADVAATVNNVLLGISQGAGVDGGAILNGVLLQGVDENQSGLTEGDVQFASNTAGGISSTPGTIEVTVGIAKSATELYFAPRFNQQITEAQQDALVGNNTDIAVGTGNLFVTQTGLQKSSESYAADAQANDTYVITLDPVPTSLVNGMTLRFKANTANTGPATLNVNGLGALAIVTGLDTPLVTGAIAANQVCVVTYNSTGAVWQLINPKQILSVGFTNGNTSKNAADVSTTQNIAHGLGIIPKKVRITATMLRSGAGDTSAFPLVSTTVYNGTTQSSVSYCASGSTQSVVVTTFTLNGANSGDGVSDTIQTGVITFDATNIIITWTKTGNPTGTYQLLWEAEA